MENKENYIEDLKSAKEKLLRQRDLVLKQRDIEIAEIDDRLKIIVSLIPRDSKPANDTWIKVDDVLKKSFKDCNNWEERIIIAVHQLGKKSSIDDISKQIRKIDPHIKLQVEKSVSIDTPGLYERGVLSRDRDGRRFLYYLKEKPPVSTGG